MTKPEKEDDVLEMFKLFAFAIVVTWIPFSIFEIYIPFVDKEIAYQKKCEEKGGFVYSEQNHEKICIRKDYVIVIP